MTDVAIAEQDVSERRTTADASRPQAPRSRRWKAALLAGGVVALTAVVAGRAWHGSDRPPAPPPAPPPVTVSLPLQRTVQATGRFLGQFSAVDTVQLRAQVGGTLTSIGFKDGQIVHAGDPLFVIDPRPFQIRLDEAVAQFQTAKAREVLSAAELWRAQQLKKSDFGSAEAVDERAAEERSAQAAIDTAKAAIMDARLDLEFSRVTAPFTGRIGEHLV
jgi:membrane fusion protein, multidrug efflux system